MNSPFPGMNPYLENPVFWSEVHHRLIAVIADDIEPNIPPQYRVAIVVSKSEIRPQAKLYGFSIREKIPTFVLPLQSGDKEVILDLQPLLNRIYARARYYLTIDYNQEPIPPLKAEDKAWADTLLQGTRE